MDPDLLDLVRRWLSRRGLIGWIASVFFGIYVVMPAAIHAEQATVKSLASTFDRAAQQIRHQQMAQLRQYDKAHHIRVEGLPILSGRP